MRKDRDEHDAIWGKGPLPGPGERLDNHGLSPEDALYNEVYSVPYDDDGDEVKCDRCGDIIIWRESDGVYMCRRCGQSFTRRGFFNFAGLTPLGEECYTCDNLYPGCMWCRYGYIK